LKVAGASLMPAYKLSVVFLHLWGAPPQCPVTHFSESDKRSTASFTTFNSVVCVRALLRGSYRHLYWTWYFGPLMGTPDYKCKLVSLGEYTSFTMSWEGQTAMKQPYFSL
jgi:hypothetical protein